jgi:serine/threonine protein kinase/tetratricopeptide (TPR) repeat protein
MIGSTISHYKVLEKLGEGGMGVVYKAEDLKLKRLVALKFLPQNLTRSDDELARFQQEAQAAATLNHPNICTIHAIGEHDRQQFIDMEFVDGETLRAKLPISDLNIATALAGQIAGALQEAHSNGIIHRDIKADNIMVNAKGQVKVMDFGLAKLKGTLRLTRTTSTVGTLAYMAPELMQGGEADMRSDIFSYGIVLFEMLAGKTPFRGEHEAAIMYSIVNEEPTPMERFRQDVPPFIQNVISKSLQKDPAHRYQNFGELLGDLQRPSQSHTISVQATTDSVKSIVVLPFENTSSDKENEYFSDGLTEEIISDLSKIRSLRVISRTSAMRLKGTTKDVRAIAQELNVRYVLEGSVRKAGQSLRITAQLIDGKLDTNLWSEKYTGTLDDIFEMQEGVSRSIVGALKVTLSSDEEHSMEERPINNAQAYDLYLKARRELMRGVPESLERSTQLLNQGLAIVGENELLYAALGYVHIYYFRWISKVDINHISRARDYAQKVFSINPSSSHGHSLQGTIYYAEGNIGEAIRSTKKALSIEPTNTEALLSLAVYYSYVGRHVEATRTIDDLIAIDPLLPINIFIKGVVFVYQGDFANTLPWTTRAYMMDPQSPLFRWSQAIALAWCNKHEAIALIDELAAQAPGWVYTHHGLFLKHALKGEKDIALRYDTEDLRREAQHDCHFALHVAHCYALIHENEKALNFLEHSVKMGMLNYSFLSKYDPLLENLRGDERFKKLMERVKVLQEELIV